jgi:hypothetical protein
MKPRPRVIIHNHLPKRRTRDEPLRTKDAGDTWLVRVYRVNPDGYASLAESFVTSAASKVEAEQEGRRHASRYGIKDLVVKVEVKPI